MFDYKKQYDLFKNVTDVKTLVERMSIAIEVDNCNLKPKYEQSLLGRKITANEFNLLCDFVYNFNSPLTADAIVSYLFQLLTLDKDLFENATTLDEAAYTLPDLKNKNKVNEMYNVIRQAIADSSDEIDW